MELKDLDPADDQISPSFPGSFSACLSETKKPRALVRAHGHKTTTAGGQKKTVGAMSAHGHGSLRVRGTSYEQQAQYDKASPADPLGMRSRAMMVENIFTMGLCADCLSIGCAQSTTDARDKSSRISNSRDEICQRAVGGGDRVRVLLAEGQTVKGVHLESDD